MKLDPPLYVVKVKYFKTKKWIYTNDSIMQDAEKSVSDEMFMYFIYKNLAKAQKTMLNLILQKRPEIEAIKVVNLSHYPPYAEFEVISYHGLT